MIAVQLEAILVPLETSSTTFTELMTASEMEPGFVPWLRRQTRNVTFYSDLLALPGGPEIFTGWFLDKVREAGGLTNKLAVDVAAGTPAGVSSKITRSFVDAVDGWDKIL